MLFSVIHEDERLLVLNKPAGLVCHPTKGDALSSLISRVRLHLGERAQPQLINRLDRETSGLVVVAKDSESAAELRKMWERRDVRKEYLAITHGEAPTSGMIETHLGKAEGSAVAIKDAVRLAGNGPPARTEFSRLKIFERDNGRFSVLRVVPRSGRKHQIRIHLAHIGHAIVGDKIYGPDEQIYLRFVRHEMTMEDREKLILENHALHAALLKFEWNGQGWIFEAPPEAAFNDFIATGRAV